MIFFFLCCVNILISWVRKIFLLLNKVLYLAKSQRLDFSKDQTHQASVGQPTLVRTSLEGKRKISGGETQTDPSCMWLGGCTGVWNIPEDAGIRLQQGHKCRCLLIVWGEEKNGELHGAGGAGSETEIKRTKNQMPHVPVDCIPAFLSITSQFVFKSSYSGLVEKKIKEGS